MDLVQTQEELYQQPFPDLQPKILLHSKPYQVQNSGIYDLSVISSASGYGAMSFEQQNRLQSQYYTAKNNDNRNIIQEDGGPQVLYDNRQQNSQSQHNQRLRMANIDHDNKRSFQLKQPKTANGLRSKYNKSHNNTFNQGVSTQGTTTADPRSAIRARKQKLHNTFIDILNHGQTNHQLGYTPASQRDIRVNQGSNMDIQRPFMTGNGHMIDINQMHDTSKQDWLNQYKNYQSKVNINNSFKNNYLKYHLMRQLLEKKNMSEINSLKHKIADSNVPNPLPEVLSGNSTRKSQLKEIIMKQNTSDDSDQSSEMSDDVEIFEFNQPKQASVPQQSVGHTKVNTSQGSVDLKRIDDNLLARGGSFHANNATQLEDSPQNYRTQDNFNNQRGISQTMNRYQPNDIRMVKTANIGGNRRRNISNKSQLSLENQGNKSCVITKYNYQGRPPTSQVDSQSQHVAKRKQKLEMLKLSANVKGCHKFNERSRKADVFMREQQNLPLTHDYSDNFVDYNNFNHDPFQLNSIRTLGSQLPMMNQTGMSQAKKTSALTLANTNIEWLCAVETLNQKRLQPNVQTNNDLLGALNVITQKGSHTSKPSYSQASQLISKNKINNELTNLKLEQIPQSVSNLHDKIQNLEHYNTKDWRPQPQNQYHKALITQGVRDKQELQNIRSVYTSQSQGRKSHTLKNLLLSKNGQVKAKLPQKRQDISNQMQQQPEVPQDEIFFQWADVSQSFVHLINTNKFGDFYGTQPYEQAIIKDFAISQFPVLETKQVQCKIAKSYNEFNVIFLGKDTPLSKCCKLTMCLSINGSLGNAKVYCMEKLCQFNPLTQILVPIEVLQILFPQNYDNCVVATNDYKKYKQPSNTEINKELKKTVLAGSYKYTSLRKVVSGTKQSSASNQRNKSTKSNKQRLDTNEDRDSLFEERHNDIDEEVEYLDVSYPPIGDEALMSLEQNKFHVIKEEYTIDDKSDMD